MKVKLAKLDLEGNGTVTGLKAPTNNTDSATKKYVESFNGNYTYMRVLKYFIWKDEKRVDSDGMGYVNEISDLATYIENNGKEFNTEWAANLK